MSIRLNSVESTKFSEHPQSTDALYKSCANRLPVCRIDITGNKLCRFNRTMSNQQHFQPLCIAQLHYTISLAQMDFRRVKSTLTPTNRVNSIQEITNRLPVMRIANARDESTLIGCIGQPSLVKGLFCCSCLPQLCPSGKFQNCTVWKYPYSPHRRDWNFLEEGGVGGGEVSGFVLFEAFKFP